MKAQPKVGDRVIWVGSNLTPNWKGKIGILISRNSNVFPYAFILDDNKMNFPCNISEVVLLLTPLEIFQDLINK